MDKQVTNKTLLEILVDELPGLGGWHEGACNIAQDKSGIAWFYRERPRFVRTVWAGDSDKDVELPLATATHHGEVSHERAKFLRLDDYRPNGNWLRLHHHKVCSLADCVAGKAH
ncbi:hypothetical protein ACN09C_14735 [Serratia fonticola]|uniref:hypothetical protein n=1 Tax=Serratia fonticola TaxID=47917 RepID=UPI003B00BF98